MIDTARITRRDCLNGTLLSAGALGVGGAAARSAGDTFTGYGGTCGYAHANGNTWAVAQSAHRLRDGGYTAAALEAAVPTGEYDLIVVGGGIAGG